MGGVRIAVGCRNVVRVIALGVECIVYLLAALGIIVELDVCLREK